MKLYETPQTKNAAYIKARPINPIGIFVHSTGASNATLKRYVDAPALLGTNLYGNHWNKTTATKAVHAFIGLDKNKEVAVCHCLPYNIACWGAGGGSKGSYNYNPQAHVQFEICEDNAPRSGKAPTQDQRDYYNAAFLAAEEYCAYLCKLLNLSPQSIVGHYEAAKRGYANNHSDPANWMSIYGDSMDNFRSRVAARLKVETSLPQEDPPKEESKPETPAPVLKNDPVINMRLTKQENATFFGKSVGDIIKLPTEEYLLGVVPAEIGNAHIEACKAQAIAARSIVRYWTRNGATITDSSSHQSYRAPRSVNTAYGNAHRAVKETAGQVLMYGGKIAQTYFADSNGGKMVASKEHWSADLPYLVTKDDPWTKASGKPYNGHPVGMSQQGAIWAANNGKTHREILAFYYPGTTLVTEGVEPTLPPVTENPVEPAPSEDALYFAEVVTRNPVSLNIWSNTRKNKSLKVVPKGVLVEVLQIVDGTWAKVRYEGVTGYSDRQYLKRQDEPADVLYMAKVKTRFPLSLNLWREANKIASIRKIPNGATVDVLKEVTSVWAKVRYNGSVGYVDRQYLEKEGKPQQSGLYKAEVKTVYPLSLNIWREPRKGISLTKVPRGAEVSVLEEVSQTWAKVSYGQHVGYSDRKYLIKKGN